MNSKNPCDDSKHKAIWFETNQTEICEKIPKFIIIGPQRTGTTALYTFLKANKFIKSNQDTRDFEEAQFFMNKNYFKGVNWQVIYVDFLVY